MALDEGEALVFQQIVGARLHVQLDELGLVVEQFVLRRRAGHVQVDDAFGLRRELRRTRCQGIVSGRGGTAVALEQRRQGDGADAGVFEELPACLGAGQFKL